MAEKITSEMYAGQSQMIADMARMRAEAGATALPPVANELTGVAQPSFGSVLNQAINHVDNLQHVASARQCAVETGKNDDFATSMLESQKTSIAFSVLTQVRDKISSAFNDIINTAL